jgi:hypothetical protein
LSNLYFSNNNNNSNQDVEEKQSRKRMCEYLVVDVDGIAVLHIE